MAMVSAALVLPQRSSGFSPPKNAAPDRRRVPPAPNATPPAAGSTSRDATAASDGASTTSAFPVLRRLAGADWLGDCRYVDAGLRPVADLVLTGGLRFDLDAASAACTFASFLTFPNGKTRRVEMAGFRDDAGAPTMRLDPVEEGPIHMILAELMPDTVLVNEVESMSGKTVMTTSLSVVNGGEELVMVSHEVGDGVAKIEGHQVWRLRKANAADGGDAKGKDDAVVGDGSFRDTTGR